MAPSSPCDADTVPATLVNVTGLITPPQHTIRRCSTLDLLTPTSVAASSGSKSAAEAIAALSQDEVTALVRESLESQGPGEAGQPAMTRKASLLTHAASFAESNSVWQSCSLQGGVFGQDMSATPYIHVL